MEDAEMEDVENSSPNALAELSVIFAICAGKAGRCGIAYVDLDENERVLYVADVMDPEFIHLDRLKQRLLGHSRQRQGLCIVPSRSPAELLESAGRPLQTQANEHGGPKESGGSDGQMPFPTATVKAGDFALKGAKQRLAELWTSFEKDLPRTPRSSPFSALDGNEQLLCAAGGLLRFLEQNGTLLGDLQGRWGPRVQDIAIFSPDDAVFVDAQTMIALQIFQEQHTLLMRVSKRPSEGLSLWSLLEPLVASPSGAKQLRRWLQQPSRQLEVLKERQDAIEQLMVLLQGSNAEVVRQLHRQLRMIQDLPRLLSRMHRCYNFDNMADWRSLVTTLGHMSTALGLLEQASKLCKKDVAAFTAGHGVANDVHKAEGVLQRVVDWERNFRGDLDASLVHVQSGVDQGLDDLRHEYDTVEHYLSEAAALENRRLGNTGGDFDSIVFHYFPQLGFHASLPNLTGREAETMDGRQDDIPLLAPDWHYQFAGHGRLFYKCDMARRLDREVGDLVVDVRNRELDILMELLSRLRILEPRLRTAAQRLAELDVLLAFTAAALKYQWVKPKLSDDPKRLHIVKGRHPLVEAASTVHNGFVSNSTEIGLEEAETYRVQVITGANLSGKSVYLKQVGLITYMAQIGCFVPADEAELGLCDFIFSRIQSCETASATCSSFTLDLCQLSLALKHSTAASLVLLDEFGKGTRAADGVALLGSTIEYLCRWQDGPKALVATHFTEIFRLGLVSETEPHLQVSHLRVLPQSENSTSSIDQIAYLYQLVPGCAEKSFGLDCARKAGLDADVLQRAAEILSMIERRKAIPLKPIERQGARQVALCRSVVQRLCALDLENETETKEFLAFVSQSRERLRPLLVSILPLIWSARGEPEKSVEFQEEEPYQNVRVFENAVTDAEAAELQHLIQMGQKTSCCGYWAERGAAKMQQLVAQQLQISRRHLGDVHFDNISAVRAVRDEHSYWSGVAVLYLEDLDSKEVQLKRQSDHHEVEILDVTRGSLVQVPEGAVLVHTKPLRVAWTRVRAPDAPMRGFFEFYLASWVQRHFVMPYDTTHQRKFFRKHTRHPRYWHGFLWSFVGTFCSVFACLPLAWFGVQALARASKCEDPSDEGLSPTLLPRVGRKLGQGKPQRESAPSFAKAFGFPTDTVKDAHKL